MSVPPNDSAQVRPYQGPGYPPPGYPAPGYPESSQAMIALILGIVGLVTLQLLGPFAWWLGQSELRAIAAGRRDPLNRMTAMTGMILGIVSSAYLVVFALVSVLYLVLAGGFILLPLLGYFASAGAAG